MKPSETKKPNNHAVKSRQVTAGKSKKKTKPKDVKSQIRDIERLLRLDKLPDTVRNEKQRILESLKVIQGQKSNGELEKKMSIRYKKVKFTERVKLERKLKQKNTLLAKETKKKSRKAIEKEIKELQIDLRYCREFPRDKKYISILKLPAEMDATTLQQRTQIRNAIIASKKDGSTKGSETKEVKKVAEVKTSDETDDFFIF
eukprot:m.62257 g.62257  ORF g.62257 m.62257 type:complete len:202 (+) comp11499_c0_seq2:312-917(+)